LVQQVLDHIKDLMVELEPGKPLPTEIEISEKLGISRKTLRSAMRRLEQDGAVKRVRGKGTFPTRGKLARAIFRAQAVQLGMVAWTGVEDSKGGGDFYPQILRGATDEALHHRCHIVLSGGTTNNERAEACYRLGDSSRIEGLILVALTDQSLLEEIAARGKPACLVDHFSERAKIDCVRVDSAGGSSLAVEHLRQLGHRRIAYIDTPYAGTNLMRAKGYRDAMDALKLPRQDDWVVRGEGSDSVDGGAQAAMRLMALPAGQRPTAILAFSDEMALGAMAALIRFGLRVPEDISVVGTGGPKSPLTVGLPALTTVRFDSGELGRTAVQYLLERLDDPRLPIRNTMLPGRLDLGRSTAPPSA
jgi:LacI family transcriptional regulator